MRILPFSALNLASLIATTGLASDVVYKLDERFVARPEASISIEPGEFKIADRAWAAPGVEQSSKDLLPPVDFDYTGAPRLRIEAAEECSDTGTRLRYPHVGPEWLDDVAWPLTRELYGLGRPYDGGDNRTEYTFGLITLQR
jgi:hypothetical protein